MMTVFYDGLPHSVDQLRECLADPLSSNRAVTERIHILRKKLEPIGETIVTELVRGLYMYRHTRLVSVSAYE